MYKYKQTTDVELGDLVVWTKMPTSITNRVNDKVYKVIRRTMNNNPLVVDETGLEKVYGKDHGFKVLQTKPADQAVVGDYMYRISSGSVQFPQHSVIKITRTGNNRLGYSEELGVDFDEVIVIAQAESEVKYPLFMHWYNNTGTLVKFDGLQSGTQLTDCEFNNAGDYSLRWSEHTDPRWKPCDFTTEPEIFDLDWWQSRFEAGLPVYAIYMDTTIIRRCKTVPPKQWGEKYTFSMTDLSLVQKTSMSKEDIELFKYANAWKQVPLGATADCSLHPTTKEQPMNKTTLKLLLELLGASEEVKDATNSKFVGIITNEDEYVGYMYFDSKEDATECMAQPKMELHKLHLFEKSCVLAQKPRKVIEV